MCSCKDTDGDITGVYKSDYPSMLSRYFSGEHYSKGIILTLSKDSSFIHDGCAQITKGKWTYKSDSLYLYCEDIQFKIDSFNYLPKYKKGTICGTEPKIYYKEGDIITTWYNIKGTKTKVYDRLKKVE